MQAAPSSGGVSAISSLLGGREAQVDPSPLELMLCQLDSSGNPEPSSARPLTVSRKRKVKDLLKDIQQTHAQAVPVGDLRIWHRPDNCLDQSKVNDINGWEVVSADTDTLEDAGISDSVSLLLEQRVPGARGSMEWPFFARQRRAYCEQTYKDPRNPKGPTLTTGDKIDALEDDSGSPFVKKWYPAAVVDEDNQRVLVQFHYRKPPPEKIPEITKEKAGWFSSSVELSDETTAALKKVFSYYASLDSDKTHVNRKAVASLISCATNTICQQDDYRVTNMFRDFDTDKDGLLTVDDFLRYWSQRASNNTHWLKEELQYLYKRAKIDFGASSEEDKLLQEGKEWIPRNSERLAAAKSHVSDYPYLRHEEREFRDFRAYDRVDFCVGREWYPARVVTVDWNDQWSVLVERTPGPGTSGNYNFGGYSSYSSSYSYESSSDPSTREWVPIESERLAKYQSRSLADCTDKGPKDAAANLATGACDAPGACGLNNLGNTCFMNSTLQALSQTPTLRHYYRSGQFEGDICRCPLSMEGRLAAGFCEVLNMLWADTHRTISPSKLKQLIGEKRPDFQGYQQHDAQELLTFLLDGLHEDGNRVPYPRPIVEDPKTEGKPDEAIATEAWQGYLTRNSSYIVELFQFQVRSEVTFPKVGEKSLTFDPMMYLSLHVPKPPHSVQVTVLPSGYPGCPPVKCNFVIPRDKTFKDLDLLVAEAMDSQNLRSRSRSAMVIPDETIKRSFRFADLYDNRIYKFFNSDRQLSEIRSVEKVWALETDLLRDLPVDQHEFYPVNIRRKAKPTYSSTYDNGSYSFSRFAPPYILAVQLGVTTNAEVRRRMMAFADSLRHELMGPGDKDVLEVSLTVVSTYGNDEGVILPETGVFELANGSTLSLNFLDVEAMVGKENMLPAPIAQDEGGDPEGGEAAGRGLEVTLEQCLDSFQQCEELAQDDWVYCKKTAEFEFSLKKLDIWSVPQGSLIIHLKRFGRERLTGPLEKIDTLVRFPMNIDLSPWIRGAQPADGAKFVLYATVNHSGGLGGGHYTAYARVGEGPPQERPWYYFNDSSVSRASEVDVVSKASYILFYERVRG